MNEVVNIKGYIFRENDEEILFIPRDDDFIGTELRGEVIDFLLSECITSIELNESFHEGDLNLDFLEKIAWLESIVILKSNIVDYRGLSHLKGLKKLVANYTSAPIEFSMFKSLSSANILWTETRASIIQCRELKMLTLHKFKDGDLRRLSGLKILERLELIGSSISSLDGIEGLKSLEFIELAYNSKITGLSGLGSCVNLRELKLDHLSKLEELSFLDNCHALQSLSIHNCKRIRDCSSIFNVKGLKRLGYLRSGDISTLKAIGYLKDLERLVLYDTNVLDGDLRPIQELKKLTYCFFKDKKHYNLKCSDISRA